MAVSESCWDTAGNQRTLRDFPDGKRRCKDCGEPILGVPYRHHVCPKLATWVFGIRFHAWWNCIFRDYVCEQTDSHDVTRRLCEAGKKLARRNGLAIAKVAGARLKALAALPAPAKKQKPEGITGHDRYGIAILISRIPEEYLEQVPVILNEAILAVLGPPQPMSESVMQERREMAERQLAAEIEGRALMPLADQTDIITDRKRHKNRKPKDVRISEAMLLKQRLAREAAG